MSDPDTIAQLAATHGLPKEDKRIQVMAGRMAKLKALRVELAAQYSLTVDDPRIQQGALAKLNQGNWEAKVLLGNPVPNTELQAYTNIISQLLGPPAVPLTVRFVDQGFCKKCKADLTADELAEVEAQREARQQPKANAEHSPLPEAPAPPPAVEAAPPAQSANIVALHKDIHAGAPLARHDEPWRASIASEFRRFDIPENF